MLLCFNFHNIYNRDIYAQNLIVNFVQFAILLMLKNAGRGVRKAAPRICTDANTQIHLVLIKALPLKPLPSPYSAMPSRGGNVVKTFIKITCLDI